MADGRNSDGTFAPGNPGGPGRNRSPRRIEAILQRIGEEEVKVSGETITKLEAVLRAVFSYALKGQSWAVQFIAERTEGKVREAAPIGDPMASAVPGLRFVAADPPAAGEPE